MSVCIPFSFLSTGFGSTGPGVPDLPEKPPARKDAPQVSHKVSFRSVTTGIPKRYLKYDPDECWDDLEMRKEHW